MIEPFHVDASLLLTRVADAERSFDAVSEKRDKPFYSSLGLSVSRILTRFSQSHRTYSVAAAVLFSLGIGWWLSHSYPLAVLLAIVAAAASVRYSSLPWLAVYVVVLPYLIYHELSHLAELTTKGVTNAAGQRLPLRRYITYLEAEVNGTCVKGGIKGALLGILARGDFPAFRVNIDRMEREWYWDIDIRELVR